MISIYAGIITENDGSKTVEKFVPFTISRIMNNYRYYNTSFNSISVEMWYDLELDGVTGMFDSTPSDIRYVLSSLSGIDINNTGYKNLVINFFSEENIDNILPFELDIYSESESYINCYMCLKSNSLGFRFNLPRNRITYILSNPKYPCSSIEELLNVSKEVASLDEKNNIATFNWMCFAETMLFCPFVANSSVESDISRYATNFNSFSGVAYDKLIGRVFTGLYTWNNWYTFLTGKYAYGNPISIELQNEINGISKIDLTLPVGITKVDEGLATESTFSLSGNSYTNTSYGLRYFNLGTDLCNLFTWNTNTETVFLKNGALIKSIENGKLTFTLKVGEEGFKCSFFEGLKYGPRVLENPDGGYCSGLYLSVPAEFVNINPSNWINEISNDFSKMEYGKSPLCFSTVHIGWNTWVSNVKQYIKSSYVDYSEINNFPVPMLSINAAGPDKLAFNAYWEDYPISYTFWENLFTGTFPEGEINIGGGSIGGGNSTTGGGTGVFDDISDNIEVNTLPSGFTGASNFFNIYTVYDSSLTNIGVWLNKTGVFDAKDKPQGIISVKEIYGPFIRDEMFEMNNGLPVVILGDTVENAVKYNLKSGRYIRKNLGEINIKEYFGNFLDYEPYTSISIYLPYSGIFDLDVNKIINAEITLYATLDILTGCIVYQLKLKKYNLDSILYTFEGNCGVDIPITSSDYSNRISSAINTGISIGASVAAVATGVINPAVGVAASVVSAANNLSSAAFSSPTRTLSSSFNTLSGCMNVQYPYLIINRPKMSLPTSYAQNIGYPSNISSKLKALSGFTVVKDIHLDGLGIATETEINEIYDSLKSGVIL